VRLISPEYVRPYVKAQKNDDRDAEAIAEAATRPTMRFVEIKSEAQLDMRTLHRARECLVAERTALINQVRTGEEALFLRAQRWILVRRLSLRITEWLSRSDEASVRSSLPLPLCWLQLSPIRRLLKTTALFPYRR
jgi:transposase